VGRSAQDGAPGARDPAQGHSAPGAAEGGRGGTGGAGARLLRAGRPHREAERHPGGPGARLARQRLQAAHGGERRGQPRPERGGSALSLGAAARRPEEGEHQAAQQGRLGGRDHPELPPAPAGSAGRGAGVQPGRRRRVRPQRGVLLRPWVRHVLLAGQRGAHLRRQGADFGDRLWDGRDDAAGGRLRGPAEEGRGGRAGGEIAQAHGEAARRPEQGSGGVSAVARRGRHGPAEAEGRRGGPAQGRGAAGGRREAVGVGPQRKGEGYRAVDR
jgi:hypothetical protein